ncbi:hypothetical protein K2173_009214 [Erythroxylum novogranatense]|uniref:Uncharacterized protein n=1 Tax=Erythroxylum novogranatense TaxID=1862640 RepID=A0AAV8TJ40_9ROSI|nr:hypothetical protein K2173_009214 [Erythroxylum novogranatense]
MAQLELVAKQVIPEMIRKYAEQGRPVSCFINNPFIPWVSDVAESLGLPSAMLWVQSCACFSAYYHYYHKLVSFPTEENPEIDVQLPCVPLLKYDEVPSFLHPATPYPFLRRAILGQFKNLDKPFCILMDTFQDLENDTVEYMSKLCPLIRTVGPLFKNPKEPNSKIRADFYKPDDCIEWLDSKPPSSVVYISFGSVVFLKQDQAEEIAYGLLTAGVNFLWVLRPPSKDIPFDPITLPDEFLKKVGDKAKIVQWCPQEKVLAHSSVSCFVGVRMCRGQAENKLITRDEVERCLLEATVGPKAEEIKRNASKWKAKAEAAAAEGGSSDRNIQAFIEEVKMISLKQVNQLRMS